MRLFLLAAFILPSFAQADWNHVRCQKPGDKEFLLIQRDGDGRYHVESSQTRRYLLGLECKVPNPADALFHCEGPAQNNLQFESALIHERGFPKESYGEFVDREYIKIDLFFNYVNGKGESSRVERNWKFETSECVTGGAQ